MIHSLSITTPHEKTVTLHNSHNDAVEAARRFYLQLLGNKDNVATMALEELAGYFDSEITYDINTVTTQEV